MSATRTELANAIRFLAIDAVEAAKSGHPGMPMGMADIAEVLWNDFLRHNPSNPKWFNRDRFVPGIDQEPSHATPDPRRPTGARNENERTHTRQ